MLISVRQSKKKRGREGKISKDRSRRCLLVKIDKDTRRQLDGKPDTNTHTLKTFLSNADCECTVD